MEIGAGYGNLTNAIVSLEPKKIFAIEKDKKLVPFLKNKFKNFSLEQLIRLQELLEKKDYSHEKKAGKWKKKLLTDINVEIYKRDDAAIWK